MKESAERAYNSRCVPTCQIIWKLVLITIRLLSFEITGVNETPKSCCFSFLLLTAFTWGLGPKILSISWAERKRGCKISSSNDRDKERTHSGCQTYLTLTHSFTLTAGMRAALCVYNNGLCNTMEMLGRVSVTDTHAHTRTDTHAASPESSTL